MNKQQDILLTESHLKQNERILAVVEKNSKLPPLLLTEAMKQYEMIRSQSSRRKKNTQKEPLVVI